jgi:hypothetical protein
MDQVQASKGTQMKAEKLVNLVVGALALPTRYGNMMAIFIAFISYAGLTNDRIRPLVDLTNIGGLTPVVILILKIDTDGLDYYRNLLRSMGRVYDL